MEKITEYCTGCRACEQLCPKNAISFIADKEGFLVPCIDQEKCIDCGLCQHRCPQNANSSKNSPQKVFAARYKDETTLYKSASGGAFAALAQAVIKEGGIVFGVVYDKDWNAVFTSAENELQLDPILSSKYVQADTQDSYKEVLKQLQTRRLVLYCGTGCQIAGLRSFLKKDYENLLCVDLICHGVASPMLFRKYIVWLSEKHGAPISEFDFRDKKGGWGLGYKYKYKYKYKSCNTDPYYYHFLRGDIYRECCYRCRYCTKERMGDWTIGDFWGIEKEHPSFFSPKGVSVILVNSTKGLSLLEKYQNSFHLCESTFEKAAKHNENLLHPTRRNDEVRDKIYDGIGTLRFADLEFVQHFTPSLTAKVKELVPMWLKVMIKRNGRV